MSKPSNEPLLHGDRAISIVQVKGVIQTPTGARMTPWVAVAVLLLAVARRLPKGLRSRSPGLRSWSTRARR
jgi:hypothetical protein